MADKLFEKLSPERLLCSGKMTAVLGCICGQQWTNPRIVELCVTSDGVVLGVREGDCGANEIVGDRSDLVRNLRGVADAVGLTHEERLRFAVLAGHSVPVHGTPVDWVDVLV